MNRLLPPDRVTHASAEHPDELLEALCQTHPQSAASLRLVHEVCAEQERVGRRDFSLATIGKLCSAKRGPSASYLRTKSAHRYVALIRAFAKKSGPQPRRRLPRITEVDSILEGLNDPTVRVRVGILFSELQSLRREKRGFGGFAASKAPIPVNRPARAVTEQSNSGLELTDLERLALRQALDPGRLSEWGWRIDEAGRVVTKDSGAVVFPAGFASAVRKMVASCESPATQK